LEVVFVTSLIGSRVEGWSFTGGSKTGCEADDVGVGVDVVEDNDGRDRGGEGDVFAGDGDEPEALRGEGDLLNVGIPEGIVDELEVDDEDGGEGDLLTTDANCAGTGDGGL
jgi:hypothetical protein